MNILRALIFYYVCAIVLTGPIHTRQLKVCAKFTRGSCASCLAVVGCQYFIFQGMDRPLTLCIPENVDLPRKANPIQNFTKLEHCQNFNISTTSATTSIPTLIEMNTAHSPTTEDTNGTSVLTNANLSATVIVFVISILVILAVGMAIGYFLHYRYKREQSQEIEMVGASAL